MDADNIPQLINCNRFHNWVNISVAVNITCYGISEYLRSKISELHKYLKYDVCAGLKPCLYDCSQTADSTSTWCDSCQTWKAKLLTYVKYNTHKKEIIWKNIASSKWTTDVEEVVKVFAPYWWTNRNRYWEDLSVGLSIIHNCKIFELPPRICHNAKSIRDTFSHSEQKLGLAYCKKAINSLSELLKCKEIQETKSAKIALQQLEWLKKNDINININRDDKFNFKYIIEAFKGLEEFQEGLKYIRNQLVNNNAKYNSDKKTFLNLANFIITLMFVVLIYLLYDIPTPSGVSDTGCLSMTPVFPTENRLDFSDFLEDHNIFVGRKWLLEDIKRILIQKNRGILLTAEMGYGKTALISHMICCSSESSAYDIKKRIMYYHICKFDIYVTQRVDIFIKHFVTILMGKYPAVGNAIHMSSMAMTFLESSLCREDPYGCFEYLLVFPLRKIEDEHPIQYVIIDALDECAENMKDTISLLTLLSNKLQRLPNFIKFILTSRMINIVFSKLTFLHHYPLSTTDERNNEDIIKFLDIGIKKYFLMKERSIRKVSRSKRAKANIIRLSRGNFLYAFNLLSSEKEGNTEHSSSYRGLYSVYTRNLHRIFGDCSESFDLPRQCFEILCALSKPMAEEDLIEVMTVTSADTVRKFRIMVGTSLSHFIQQTNGILTLSHNTICDFLSNQENLHVPCYISKENGHSMLARHLFLQSLKFNKSIDIIDLVIHVSESKHKDLLYIFTKEFNNLLKNQFSNESLLHKLSRQRNTYRGAKLLISLSTESVNNFNAENVTPVFLAAKYGNDNTLKAFIEEGGNTSFIMKSHNENIPPSNALYVCKFILHCRYSILDIAAQNGHRKVVQIILEVANHLTTHINWIGLKAIHLAVEQGHVAIVDMMLKYNKSLGDQQALFLASKNGYPEIVCSLIEAGVNDTCLRRNISTLLFKQKTTIVQTTMSTPTFYRYFIENVDGDATLLSSRSALEAAVRFGHLEVVKLLLSQVPNSLHCREFGGRSPILTALKYNKTAIFEYLLRKGAHILDLCLNHINDLNSKFLGTTCECSQYLQAGWQNASGIPTFLIMYGRERSLLYEIFKSYSAKLCRVANHETALPQMSAPCRSGFASTIFTYFVNVIKSFASVV